MRNRYRYSLLAIGFAGALALTPFRPLKIEGRSMSPTLESGETYLLDHLYWKAGGLRRNDIVVIDRGEEYWVKRLVGMPGDRLQIHYRVDGRIVKVTNVTTEQTLHRPENVRTLVEDRTVEDGEIFVVGDNLNGSADSTSQEAGNFRLEDVIGVVRTFTLRRDFPYQQHL